MNAYTLRAIFLFDHGDMIAAESELRRAIAEGDHSATTHAMLGLCLNHAGMHRDAAEEFSQALQLDPNCAYAHYAFSFVEYGQSRQTLWVNGNRIKSILRALEIEPRDVRYLVRLAELYRASREWKKCLEAAAATLQEEPRHVWAAILRAESLTHLGHRKEAHTVLLRALETDPEASSAHAAMGWALLRVGDHQKATQFFEEALRLRPGLEWAQRGAFECAKYQYPLYRFLSYPAHRLVHRPFLCFCIETGLALLLLLAAFGTLFWLDPIIRPRWGGGAILAIFLPLIILPIALLFGKEPFFSWLVKNHRAAQLSAPQAIVEQHRIKWLVFLIVGGITVAFSILLDISKSPFTFGLLGIVPGLAALTITHYEVPFGNVRKWLLVYSTVILIIGPPLLISLRTFILELEPDPRSAILLLVPAIFVVLIGARVKQKENQQRHRRAVAAMTEKIQSK